MARFLLPLLTAALIAGALLSPAMAQPLGIVAAENFYGDIARQIAGGQAQISSIMSNPEQDPHLFEVSPSVARLLSGAAIVAYNGADYDPWMAKLLAAHQTSPNQANPNQANHRTIIVVADLMHRKSGDNPHLWYDPETAPIFAKAVAAALIERDAPHQADYQRNLQVFLTSLQPMTAKIATMRTTFEGTKVTATEPVFGYMAEALGLVMRNESFQLAVANDTEPSASDVAAMQRDLTQHQVKVLLYNSQVSTGVVQRMLQIARREHIPVVGVTETMPSHSHYQDWMLGTLKTLEQALAKPPA